MTKCPICGWVGYINLVRFECAGIGCWNHTQKRTDEVYAELTTSLVNPTIQEWDATHTHKVSDYPPYKLGLSRNIYYDALRYEVEIFTPGFCEAIQVLQYTPATLYVTPENYDQRDQLKDILLAKMEDASRYAANVFTR